MDKNLTGRIMAQNDSSWESVTAAFVEPRYRYPRIYHEKIFEDLIAFQSLATGNIRCAPNQPITTTIGNRESTSSR